MRAHVPSSSYSLEEADEDADYYFLNTPQSEASPQQTHLSPQHYPSNNVSAHRNQHHDGSPLKRLQHRYNPSLTSNSTRSHSPAQSSRKPSLNPVPVPSFTAFRAQLPRASSLKRSQHPQQHLPHPQPHPFAAEQSTHPQRSPRAASFSTFEKASPPLAQLESRPYSLTGPTSHPSAGPGQSPLAKEDIDQCVDTPRKSRHKYKAHRSPDVHRSSYTNTPSPYDTNASIDSRIASTASSSVYSSARNSRIADDPQYAHGHPHTPARSSARASLKRTPSSSHDAPMTAVQQAPIMTFQLDGGIQRTLTEDSLGPDGLTSPGSQRPKSPVSRLGSFFGWKSPQQKTDQESSPTTTFSERSASPMPSPHLLKNGPMEGPIAHARLTPPGIDIQKANQQANYFENPQTPLLLGNERSNAHVQELERELSHISQELAGSIRREMELEDELERVRLEHPTAPPSDLGRRGSDYFSDSGASSTRFPIYDVDAKVEQLEQQLRKTEMDRANIKMEMASRLQTELARRRDLEELVQNLEDQLDKRSQEGDDNARVEDLVKRLSQEKQSKESFEDLYQATKEELEKFRNERDNLRDEVVPQLRARIEGLEAHAAESAANLYENTRQQHQRDSFAMPNHEGDDRVSALRGTLTRSSSLANRTGLRRGNSIKERAEGGRQRSGSITDAVKDVEDQRDALHKALKLLIKRYERQQKDHTRAIKKLTTQREMASSETMLLAGKKTPFTKEVAFLKEEVTTLRKRTEDVLEQKWQYEKGLSGLKMDLDRAEQETRGLRILLQDNDGSATSPSVYSHSHDGFEENDAADEKLKISISNAERERDSARLVAQEYRQKASGVDSESAAQLLDSAQRMDDLADQLEKQVQSNMQLRDRLAQAVAKGEREQKDSTRQIEDMQKRLAGMEDSVLAAQQHSETTLATHDAEIRRIEDATSPRLQRLQVDVPEPHRLSPVSPLFRKSPKLGTKLSDSSLLEASRTTMLERKVRELEGLLKEAEDDMQMVVQRVNRSQMEVNDLQMERDAALASMRKLQNAIASERAKAEVLMR